MCMDEGIEPTINQPSLNTLFGKMGLTYNEVKGVSAMRNLKGCAFRPEWTMDGNKDSGFCSVSP